MADAIREVLYRYAHIMYGTIIDRSIQTALDLENMRGLVIGNEMHVEMSLDEMFFYRPSPSWRLRTPIKGLYMTGASVHPGGCVFGASRLTTARTVMSSLKQ